MVARSNKDPVVTALRAAAEAMKTQRARASVFGEFMTWPHRRRIKIA